MHDTLHIHRFAARHHIADGDGQRRASAAQQLLLDGELEAALLRLCPGDAIVLVQQIQAQVRLRTEHGDRDNARRWSDAVALCLEHALQHAGPQQLLRFASRQQALLAFVADMLHGHTARDWAWRQLSLLPAAPRQQTSAAQRHGALLRLLADTPEEGVPLLRGLLRSALWPLLLQALDDGELRGLAQSVSTRLAGPHAEAFDTARHPLQTVLANTGTALPDWYRPTQQAAGTQPRLQWALRLACTLDLPSLARHGAAAVDAQLQAWSGTASSQGLDGPAPGSATPQRPAAVDTIVSSPVQSALQPALEAAVSLDAGSAMPTTVTGHTEHGGLLLLAPLLPASGALALLEDSTTWPADALPRALHTLALALWPLAADDAAALAFCGLPPTALPPQPMAFTAAQRAALAAARQCLLQHLLERLPDEASDAPRSPEAQAARAMSIAFARVVPRRARISADPGWIDVHFQLRDVSTALRRAALDLDPGFLPWLGVVLRYRYE